MARKLWAILPARRRRRLVLVLTVAAVAAVAEAGIVVLVEPLIRALAEDDAGVRSEVTGPLVAFGLALLAKNILVVALLWFKNRELFAIQAEVSERLLDIYIRGRNPAIRDLDAGERTSFAITEPLQLVLNCYLPLVTMVAEVLALTAITTVLIASRPLETLLLIAVVGAGLKLLSVATHSRIVGYGERRKESDTRRVELIRSVIESRVEVSGLGVSSEVVGRYRVPNEASAAMTARKAFLTEAAKHVLELLAVMAVAPLALLFVYTDGPDLLTMLGMFGMAAYRAMPALNRIVVSSQSAKFGVATADTIYGIVSAEQAEAAPTANGSSPPAAGPDRAVPPVLELRFTDFQLRNGKPVMDGQALRLTPGDVCVLWGASGSGKSTLLEALVDGADGVEISFRGRRLRDGLSELRGRVGVTAQSPLILPATLGENLALGGRGPLDLRAAAPMLDVDPASVLDASSIADRLGVPIHRHAVSGGQAQRISLIRALDDAHEVVLLDEPTSALDTRTACALRERIANDGEGRIFVIVTHDPGLRQIADTVVEVA